MRFLNAHFLAAIAILVIPTIARAEVVLVGITASLTSQPQTTGRLVDIDLSTGAASNARDTGIYGMTGVAAQPSTGQLFGLSMVVSSPANSLLRFDLSTGQPTLVGSTGLPFIVEGDLAFNPVTGLLYGVQDAGASVTHRYFFRIDPTTGEATVISDLPSNANSTDYSALAFNSAGTLYCIDSSASTPSRLLTIDPLLGTITNNLPMNLHLSGAIGMAFDPTTGIAYVGDGGDGASPNFLYTLDTSAAVLSPIGQLNVTGGIAGLAFVTVPEPSSFALLSICTFAIARRVRRTKRKRHAVSVA